LNKKSNVIVATIKKIYEQYLTPNITVEHNEHGELLGFEILEDSSFIRDYSLKTMQVKLLNLNQFVK